MDEDERAELIRLRGEVNRLHTNHAAMAYAVAHIAARLFGPSEIEAWHARLLAAAEESHAGKPEYLANLTRAIDELFEALRFAASQRPPPDS